VRQRLHQLGVGLLQQLRRARGLAAVVHQPPDAAVTDVLLETERQHLWPQVAVFAHPVALLDDAAVHVDEVQTAVGSVG